MAVTSLSRSFIGFQLPVLLVAVMMSFRRRLNVGIEFFEDDNVNNTSTAVRMSSLLLFYNVRFYNVLFIATAVQCLQ